MTILHEIRNRLLWPLEDYVRSTAGREYRFPPEAAGATTIRQALAGDLGSVAEIYRSSFTYYPGDRFLRRMLRRFPQLFLVAERGGRVEGYTFSRLLATPLSLPAGRVSAFLFSVAVRPDSRGSGLGRALVLATAGSARALGLAEVSLHAGLEGNLVRWYEGLGFRKVREERLPDGKRAAVLALPTGA